MRDAAADRPAEPQDFPVWADNWSTLRLFLAVQTQWRHAGMAGVRTGLDYAAIDVALGARGEAWTPELLDGIQAMEAAVIEEDAKR